MMPPIIVCAAIKNINDDTVICGPRHGNCLNLAVKISKNYNCKDWIMGFVDQDNNFYTREQAWKIADRNGQIKRPRGFEKDYSNARQPNAGDDGILFSENLY